METHGIDQCLGYETLTIYLLGHCREILTNFQNWEQDMASTIWGTKICIQYCYHGIP